jgi:hypothetical protein
MHGFKTEIMMIPDQKSTRPQNIMTKNPRLKIPDRKSLTKNRPDQKVVLSKHFPDQIIVLQKIYLTKNLLIQKSVWSKICPTKNHPDQPKIVLAINSRSPKNILTEN